MYTTRQVADLLEMPAWKVREYARAGFLSPQKDPGGYQFQFTDLVVLRSAVRLACADTMSHRRIQRTFGRLRAQLPESRSLAEIGIATTGERVVVQDGALVWEPETGQCHFNFAAPEAGTAEPVVEDQDEVHEPDLPRPPSRTAIPLGRAEVVAHGWFELGCDQESAQPEEAIASYRRAISINPKLADAHVNLGRIFQTRRRMKDAMKHYEWALDIAPYHSTAAFNLALVYQRTNRTAQAIAMLERTVDLDPNLAEAHYNLGRLYEKTGEARDALRHFQIYKKLTGSFRRPRTRRPRR